MTTIDVLYDDDDLMVVIKPAGMATHGRSSTSLIATLGMQEHAQSRYEILSPIHRLDYGTRGPLLIAKSELARKQLQATWAQSSKTYHAWVVGKLLTARGRTSFPLEGMPATTLFRSLGWRTWGVHQTSSLVEWELVTGRTHQIRRHAAAMGHPVIGDRVYCPPPVYSGHGLHLTCTQLEWIHPRTHQKMSVTIPPAKKMKRVIISSFEVLDPSEHLPLFQV